MPNTKKKSSSGGGRSSSRGRSASKRGTREVRKKQELPGGWGQQILALILIAISVILIATWFSGEKNEAYKIVFSIIGNGMYVLPFLFTYLAVKIFRSEDNRLPTIVWIVSILLIVFASGASGVMTHGEERTHGGAVGEWINELVLPMFGQGATVFVYVDLIEI